MFALFLLSIFMKLENLIPQMDLNNDKKSGELIQKNTVDQDFEYLEKELPFAERMREARDLIEDMSNKNSSYKQAWSKKMIQHLHPLSCKELNSFFLPSSPAEDSLRKIKYDKTSHDIGYVSEKHKFIDINQCCVWQLPKKENIYSKTLLSECSLLVGNNEENIIVAHVSFSYVYQLDAAIKFMKENGINSEEIFVIASIDPDTTADNIERATIESYVNNGIPSSNIKTFKYAINRNNDKSPAVYDLTNMACIITCNDGLGVWNFDIQETFENGRFRYFNRSQFKNESIIKF